MMDDTSIPTTPSDQLELNTAFCMQGKKKWKTSNLEVLGVWFLGEKKCHLLIGEHWELDSLRVGWGGNVAGMGEMATL